MDRKTILVLVVELALVILEVIRKALNRNGQGTSPSYKVNHVLRNVNDTQKKSH